jgi:hypothetical protein
VIEEQPKRLIAWPDEESDDDRLSKICATLSGIQRDANRVRDRAGGIRLTRIAREQFTDWYERRTLGSDPFGASFQSREDHHILRLAGLLSAADGSWEIDEHHVAHSITAIDRIKHAGSLLFGSGVAASKTYTLVDRVRAALISAGRSGLSQSALTAVCKRFGTSADQQVVLSVMHEMQLVQKFSIDSGERGRPTTMYRATRLLANAKALEEVVDIIVPEEA